MWLLKTSDLSLLQVYVSSDVRYAILSHTWNGDDEVTFADLRNGCDMNTARFDKVRMTCRQAADDGYDYAWVDTCCINKENLTEFAEAINSTWRWYYDAAVCYVYLADLDPACPALEDSASIFSIETNYRPDTRWQKALAACRWFTRGWTLQELLASEDVRFYCPSAVSIEEQKTWKIVGHKRSLVRTLWEITGIDILALQDRDSLTRFVTARKMYWASRRETTKIEDRAYSLLGLFSINMPLLYGEGENAFIRLQEQIIQKRLDHSILAWDCDWSPKSATAKSSDLLFATSPEKFSTTGRGMTRWQSSNHDAAFRLTNQGIAFDGLGFVTSSDGESLAVLNVCYEDSPYQAIALLLAKSDFARVNKSCWTPRPYQRLKLVPLEGISLQPMVLWRYRPTSLLADMLPQPKIRLVGSTKFRVVAAWPEALWNSETKLFCVPLQPKGSMPPMVRAGALVRTLVGDDLALVVFTFSTARMTASPDDRNEFSFRVALSTTDAVLRKYESEAAHAEFDAAPDLLAYRDALLVGLPGVINEAEKESDLGHVFHTHDVNNPRAIAKLIKRSGALPGSNGHFFDLYLALPESSRESLPGASATPTSKGFRHLRAMVGL